MRAYGQCVAEYAQMSGLPSKCRVENLHASTARCAARNHFLPRVILHMHCAQSTKVQHEQQPDLESMLGIAAWPDTLHAAQTARADSNASARHPLACCGSAATLANCAPVLTVICESTDGHSPASGSEFARSRVCTLAACPCPAATCNAVAPP